MDRSPSEGSHGGKQSHDERNKEPVARHNKTLLLPSDTTEAGCIGPYRNAALGPAGRLNGKDQSWSKRRWLLPDAANPGIGKRAKRSSNYEYGPATDEPKADVRGAHEGLFAYHVARLDPRDRGRKFDGACGSATLDDGSCRKHDPAPRESACPPSGLPHLALCTFSASSISQRADRVWKDANLHRAA
jgi:hypothetical protein